MVSWWSPRQIPAISQLEPVVEEFVGGSLIAQGCDLASGCERVGVEDDLQGAGLGMIPAENDRFTAGAFVELWGWVGHQYVPACTYVPIYRYVRTTFWGWYVPWYGIIDPPERRLARPTICLILSMSYQQSGHLIWPRFCCCCRHLPRPDPGLRIGSWVSRTS